MAYRKLSLEEAGPLTRDLAVYMTIALLAFDRVWTNISTVRYNLLSPLQIFTSLIRLSFLLYEGQSRLVIVKRNIVSSFVIAPRVELLLLVINIDARSLIIVLTAIVVLGFLSLTKQIL